MRSSLKIFCFIALAVTISGCTETRFAAHMFKKVSPDTQSIGKYKVGNPYRIKGRWYYPKEEFRKVETGVASWYGPNFHGKPTANGEVFDQDALTAAHRTLQIPSLVRVTNLDNGRSLILRVNDRGPFSRGRVLDVSKRGAELLGFKRAGTAKIRLEVMEQESRYAAAEAKAGRSTDRFEVALNKGESLPAHPSKPDKPIILASAPSQEPQTIANPSNLAKPASVKREVLSTKRPSPIRQETATGSPQSLRDSDLKDSEKFVRQTPPTSSELYVQAGAFSNYGNAARLSTSLARLGKSKVSETTVNGKTFYRVRIGPIDTVTRADTILSALAGKGNNEAMIVVQ